MDYTGQNMPRTTFVNTGTLTGYAQVSVPVDAPENQRIRESVSNTEQALSAIQDCISALERRLDTVLSPIPPQGNAAGASVSAPPCSHLAGRLDILNDGLASAIRRLRDLAGRVEV